MLTEVSVVEATRDRVTRCPHPEEGIADACLEGGMESQVDRRIGTSPFATRLALLRVRGRGRQNIAADTGAPSRNVWN